MLRLLAHRTLSASDTVDSDSSHILGGFVVIFFPFKGRTVTPPECLIDEAAVPAVKRKSRGGQSCYD